MRDCTKAAIEPTRLAFIPMSLADEKYLALTTFKRDGTPVTTAVWAAPLDDGKIGFWTSSASGKAKRLAHTVEGHGPAVRCDVVA